ncbi:MAG: hypothetical protein ACFE0P_10310 [Oceanicaulis sp.]
MSISKNGWPSREPPHARIYASWYRLASWRTLCSRGRDLVCHVLAAYRPDKLNAFQLSDADVAAMLGCSENTARAVVKACLERGWLVLERRGAFTGPKGARGRVVSLACYPTEVRKAEPQRYEQWQPKKNSTAQNLWFTLSPHPGERRNNCGIRGAKSAERGARRKPRGRGRKD